MRKPITLLVAAMLLLTAVAPAAVAGETASAGAIQDGCAYPQTLTDATGEEFTVEESPERIVALQPSDVQTVFEVGAEDRLVGMPINQWTAEYDAGDRTDVDRQGELGNDVEAVIDLEPDIVLAANVSVAEDVQQLRDAGIDVYLFDTAGSIDGIRENIRVTGQLVGNCTTAEERIAWMDERIGALESALEGEESPLAYWALGSGMTAGEGSFQEEILTTAGVDNLGSEAGLGPWAEIDPEIIVEEDPEWIIYGADDPDDPEAPEFVDAVTETTAYEEDQLVAVDSNAINQPGPQAVSAIESIVEAVHPDAHETAMAELDGTEDPTDNETEAGDDPATGDETNDSETSDETANETDGGDETESTEDADDDDAGPLPGFGVAAALAALTIGLGLRLRR